MNVEKRLAELERSADRMEQLAALAEAEYWARTLDLTLDDALERHDGTVDLYRWLVDRGHVEGPPSHPDSDPTFYLVVWVTAYVRRRRDTREPLPDLVVEEERDLARRYPLRQQPDGSWDYVQRMTGIALRHGWDVDEFISEATTALFAAADPDMVDVVDAAEQVLREAQT